MSAARLFGSALDAAAESFDEGFGGVGSAVGGGAVDPGGVGFTSATSDEAAAGSAGGAASAVETG